MHQVIYRWEVEPASRDAFISAWEETTTRIRETTEGARGSRCLVSDERPKEIITMAKWDSLDQWKAFVAAAKTGAMSEMHTLGKLVSFDAYEQLADHTI